MDSVNRDDSLVKALNEMYPRGLTKEAIPILEQFIAHKVENAERKTVKKKTHVYKPILKAAESISDM